MAIMRVRQPQVLVVEAAGAHGMRSASVDAGGGEGGSQPVGIPAGAAKTDSKPDLGFVLVTLALVLIIWWLAFWWNPLKLVLAAPANDERRIRSQSRQRSFFARGSFRRRTRN